MASYNEKEFVDRLEKSFIDRNFFSKREVDAGYGIADLVLIHKLNVSYSNIRRRVSFNQLSALQNQKFFEIFQFIPDFDSNEAPISLKELKGKTSISESYLKYGLIQFLVKEKYIKEVGKNLFYKLNGWTPIASDIIAIEAKIKDWKRGFFQANRYKAFAEKIYLAVPKEIVRIVDTSLFYKHKIGLLSFDYNTYFCKTIIKSPKNLSINKCKKNLAVEFFWEQLKLS